MFTTFIKILPVGELPTHSHATSINTTILAGSSSWEKNGYGAGAVNQGIIFATQSEIGFNAESGGTAGERQGAKISINATHTHSATVSNTGSNQSHNNMQPYINVYIWKRTN